MGVLDGRVACITGGTRSIGRAMADAFIAEGATVVVNGRDLAKGERCLAEMNAGDRAAFYAGDAAKQSVVEGLIDFIEQSVFTLINQVVEREGENRLSCFIPGDS